MAITDLFISSPASQKYTLKRAARTATISPPTQRPTQLSILLSLPTDLILPIIAYLPNPRNFLTACRATHNLSQESYTRTTWIMANLAQGDVPKGLVAFWIGVRHRILNAQVLRTLESMGAKIPLGAGLPSAEWDGWRSIGMLIAMRGNEEVLRLALDRQLIKHWRTFIQTAYGTGNTELVGTALGFLVEDAVRTSKLHGSEEEADTDSSFDDSSDSEREDASCNTALKCSPITTLQSPLSDPILQHYALHHAITSNSPYLFHKICTLIPSTSQTWSTIAPYLFTNASTQIIETLASFITTKRVPMSILLMSARSAFLTTAEALNNLSLLVKLGAVDLKQKEDREVGIMLLRSAALDGDADVLQKLVRIGATVEDGVKESARLGGCKKCMKILSTPIKA